jgi:hypothetical protein
MTIQTQEKSKSLASTPPECTTQVPGIRQIENVFFIDDPKMFFFKEPIILDEENDEEAREGFARGQAFAFWEDPCEDGYSIEDGDAPGE